MRVHSQNLSNETKGSKGFRTWIRLGDDEWRGPAARIEAHMGRPVYALGFHLDVEDDYEDPIKVAVWLWPFSLYGSIESKAAHRLASRLIAVSNKRGTQRRYPDHDRMIGFSLCRGDEWGTVRWHLWLSDSTWHSDDPKWRRVRWNIRDAVLGAMDYSNEELSTHQVVIPMPEKPYEATVTLERSTWRRKRFPFVKKTGQYAKVEIPGGIPHEGKGENAWDCGEDALFAISTKAATVHDAIGNTVAAVMRYRLRYGGSIWHRHEEAAS